MRLDDTPRGGFALQHLPHAARPSGASRRTGKTNFAAVDDVLQAGATLAQRRWAAPARRRPAYAVRFSEVLTATGLVSAR